MYIGQHLTIKTEVKIYGKGYSFLETRTKPGLCCVQYSHTDEDGTHIGHDCTSGKPIGFSNSQIVARL